MKNHRLFLFLIMLSLFGNAYAQDPEIDAATGFRKVGDWELVRANCIACHSAKLVTQQRGTAAQWLSMIRWMQDKQNLWAFEPDVEAKIIAYLADNYPPDEGRRRAAIAPDLMPPNPFAPATTMPDQN